jgi:hypothetical protein
MPLLPGDPLLRVRHVVLPVCPFYFVWCASVPRADVCQMAWKFFRPQDALAKAALMMVCSTTPVLNLCAQRACRLDSIILPW